MKAVLPSASSNLAQCSLGSTKRSRISSSSASSTRVQHDNQGPSSLTGGQGLESRSGVKVRGLVQKMREPGAEDEREMMICVLVEIAAL